MQKNLYYRGVLQRRNIFLETMTGFFTFFVSWPRLLLEVFIRKNFGERYFKLSTALTVASFLIVIPFVLKWYAGETGAFDDDDEVVGYGIVRGAAPSYFKPYYSWFIFTAIFVAVSIYRRLEIARNPSVFDFKKYSLYAGKINPVFFDRKIRGKKPSLRLVETVLEPLPFFLLGLILYFLLGQNLGMLLIVCSIFYGMGYVAAYNTGDNFVMDKIDEIICNQELKRSFVDGLDESETKYMRCIGSVPKDIETRRQIFDIMTRNQEEIVEVR